ncbi:MAG: Xaa-Pro peptidase family protein [Sedimenticola sp.]|uniref:Aminopeptidase P family protein n=1 Tax=Sedimenticola thiotaurini TaxID=1543721 RepID=A0A558D443_9GAMM|nr:Xaa-Pro peptidase family protein [Sedimenticola sp.]MCW8947152.1 Xaa-Pro peptidase family protein [Sedimenticola sp.]MCW8974842.1 Xaa-Pro peptidase family protein [Sedimenticola sp.]MCW9021504.1 Xaa-Pro peptidase family protein [Sedimenticola sp.]TVT55790.1 MAG: aminopeptidase P family protein [Sedimenticola thiotaurini]
MSRHLKRIKQFQRAMVEQGMGAALLFYSRDIFYYAGIAQPAFLAIFPDDYRLFVRSGYPYAIQTAGIEASHITEERRLDFIYQEYFSYLWNKTLGIELDLLPARQYLEYHSLFQGFEIVDASPLILAQRAVKSDYEVEQIRRACRIVETGQKTVKENLRPGISELELSAMIENSHRLAGHEGGIFLRHPDLPLGMGPISSGSNLSDFTGIVYSISGIGLSPALPIGPSNRIIDEGDQVVVDIPSMVNGYHADQSRTYIAGKARPRVRGMYADLREISDYVIDSIRPGMGCDQVYDLAMEKAAEMRVQDQFLRFTGDSRCRLIGHGVGIEVNEPPVLIANNRAIIPDSCVLAIEMHMLDKQAGVVKIEDTVLIRSTGNEILTKASRNLIETADASY